jgi:hypothetical protein
MRKSLICITLGIVLAVYSQNSSGQDIPRYSPQRPTISPYLNLLRNDSGPLPNYYSLVRPQLRQQSFDNRMLAATRAQEQQVQQLREITDAAAAGPTGTASTFGNLSHFRNQSHFYPVKQKNFQKR